MTSLVTFFKLLLGTVIHRPYVYAFFACYLVFALKQMRSRGAILWSITAFLIAFGCEWNSTRNGFPFGIYRYHDATRSQELWISNIPFWDSLSFVFLSYFSWLVAGSLRKRLPLSAALRLPSTAILTGLLMMLLDVVIDPLTLLGNRWFLGKVYDYPNGGTYFGVTLSNFAGWFFVGTAIPLIFVFLSRLLPDKWNELPLLWQEAALGIYAGVFLFNLAITAWIGQWQLLGASTGIALLTLGLCILTFQKRVHTRRT